MLTTEKAANPPPTFRVRNPTDVELYNASIRTFVEGMHSGADRCRGAAINAHPHYVFFLVDDIGLLGIFVSPRCTGSCLSLQFSPL